MSLAGSVSPNVASSFGSSGVGIDKSDSGTPSPPQIMSVNVPPAQLFGTPPIDEGIELDDTHAYFMDDDVSSAKRRKVRGLFIFDTFKCSLTFLIIPPAQRSCWGGILVSLRPSVRPASCVRFVAPTVLVGSISYSYILSSNFRRCVVCKVSCKI